MIAALAVLLAVVSAADGGRVGDTEAAPPDPPARGIGGEQLVRELGCAACHPGVPGSLTLVRGRAPALSSAGRRYLPVYVFQFLRDPKRVRRHIGATRMPSFHLDDRESLALALFLDSRRSDVDSLIPYPAELLEERPSRLPPAEAEGLMRGELGCFACHTLTGSTQPVGGCAMPDSGCTTAVDLGEVGARLKRDWMARYLAAPQTLDPATPMPALFFTAEPDGSMVPRTADALRRVRGAIDYLVSLGRDTRRALEREFERARRANRGVTAAMGEAIYRALNCAGCHDAPVQPTEPVGPDLSRVNRLRPDWLRRYLARPTAVRPFGFHPGSGGRMPDFRLTDEEADSVAAFLQQEAIDLPLPTFAASALSAFSTDKALQLLRDRLPCLGCHQLDGDGGRIGPDLSGVARRLVPAAIHAAIEQPQQTMPGTVMPRHLLPANRIDLVVSYLATRDNQTGAPYPSLVDHPPAAPVADEDDGQRLYGRFCASCHGAEGDGNGFNAPHLPVAPTTHADSAYMSTRPDDTLFDGIHAGGYILNRHHRMPAFGKRLTGAEIRSLVRHIRALCRCEGPGWSRDGRRN